MQAKKIPPGTPQPKPDLRDMDHFHKAAASGRLADILFRLSGGSRHKK